MDAAAYFDLCAAHDWFYEFSDDHGKWSRGRDQRAKLDALAASDPVLGAIREAFGLHMFSGPAFGCPRHPQPDRAKLIPAGIKAETVDTVRTTCNDSVHPEQLTF